MAPSTQAASRPSRWWREPILHFVLIGVLLFVVYGRMNPAGDAGQRIVVTQAVVDDLARQPQARWMRPSSEQELADLVEAHVRAEILYREGLALGLDRDDPVIKRRVQQKLDVMAEEQWSGAAPTDAELAANLAQNQGRFTRPGTVSFEQLFFDGTASAAEVERAVASARAALASGADPAKLGQPTLLPHRIDQMPTDLVARDFGAGFAEQVAQLPEGVWTGPVASGLGAHLVRVSARTPPVLPSLDAVRQRVAREWENERRDRSRSESYRTLRSRYEVVIEAALTASAAAR